MRNYIVLKAWDLNELEKKVNEMIDSGFVPQGGVGVTSKSTEYVDSTYFFQAVYRKPEQGLKREFIQR